MSLGLAHHNTWCRFILFHLCYSLNSPFHGCMVYGYKTCDTEYDVLVLAGFMNHLVWATRILSQHVRKYGHLCGCSWACFIYNFNGQCFLTLAWQYGQLFLCMCLTNFFFFWFSCKEKKKTRHGMGYKDVKNVFTVFDDNDLLWMANIWGVWF